jgi:hypothetical protein
MVLGNKENRENDLRIDSPHMDELVTKNAIILKGNTKSIILYLPIQQVSKVS